MKCYFCGVSGEKAELLDVIFEKEIRHSCKNCVSKENLYVIRKSQNGSRLDEEDEREKNLSVRDRLISISGFKSVGKKEEKKEELKKQEEELEEIVNKNAGKLFINPGEDSNLVRNFHWIVFRKRREKRLTQKQLAKEIFEPEIVIKKLEKGEVPRERERIISKIENYLGIKITNNPVQIPQKKTDFGISKNSENSKKSRSFNPEELGRTEKIEIIRNEESEKPIIESFDPITTKTLTIGDLKEMKEKIKRKLFGKKSQENNAENEKIEDENQTRNGVEKNEKEN